MLLFGDASWDYKNRHVDDANYPDHEFMPGAWSSVVPKIPSTPLKPDDRSNDRQRVPTFQWQSPWGHAASDNYFEDFTVGDVMKHARSKTISVIDMREQRVVAADVEGEGLVGVIGAHKRGDGGCEDMLGDSAPMQLLYQTLRKAAPTDAPIRGFWMSCS